MYEEHLNNRSTSELLSKFAFNCVIDEFSVIDKNITFLTLWTSVLNITFMNVAYMIRQF